MENFRTLKTVSTIFFSTEEWAIRYEIVSLVFAACGARDPIESGSETDIVCVWIELRIVLFRSSMFWMKIKFYHLFAQDTHSVIDLSQRPMPKPNSVFLTLSNRLGIGHWQLINVFVLPENSINYKSKLAISGCGLRRIHDNYPIKMNVIRDKICQSIDEKRNGLEHFGSICENKNYNWPTLAIGKRCTKWRCCCF